MSSNVFFLLYPTQSSSGWEVIWSGGERDREGGGGRGMRSKFRWLDGGEVGG